MKSLFSFSKTVRCARRLLSTNDHCKLMKSAKPELGKNVFIAPNCTVLGGCKIHDEASVFYGCVLRADINSIEVGKGTNVQDNSILHVADNYGVVIGADCTIGHGVTVHACKVGDNCLIGMGSVLLDGCEIGSNSIIGAGSLVVKNSKFPPNSLILGRPAKRIRATTQKEIESTKLMAEKYRCVKNEHISYLKKDGPLRPSSNT
eukprot:TRINITY_DN102_c1_g2_i1.p1 TRINITY_DN102_c1_g2~~TRINITY_DN102_c1_g2_i1.p1  ORF type:complete len:204 (+),score=27.31 TRINITY_DN102_c1_g2_i1:57-668(+)